MDRHMLKALESRYGYDRETHESTLLRNRRQAEELARPRWPATGTTLIAARIHDARRRRDQALVEAFTEGGAAPRTAAPGDNVVGPAPPLWRRIVVDRRVGATVGG
ncbi:MAG: hypothetical protein AAGA90_05490 [Actinomycetota bacterium]